MCVCVCVFVCVLLIDRSSLLIPHLAAFSDFKFILENDHVIGDEQIYASVIPTGPTNLPLNSSYASRSSQAYQQELGLTVLRFAKCIPDGLLVFFPSYQVMEGCIKFWQQCRIQGESKKNSCA